MAPGLGAAANQIAVAGSTVRVSFLNAATNSAGTPDTAAGSSSFYETHKKELNGSPTRLEVGYDVFCRKEFDEIRFSFKNNFFRIYRTTRTLRTSFASMSGRNYTSTRTG